MNRPDFMAGSAEAAPLRLLSETLEATLAAREPQAVLRAAAGALCRGLPAAGALWLLAEDDGPEFVDYGEVGPLHDAAATVEPLRGAALQRRLLFPDAAAGFCQIPLRSALGVVAALWLRGCTAEDLDATVRQAALCALDRAALLRSERRTQTRWSQVFEALPAALALCALDGRVVSANRQLRALLAQDGPEATPDLPDLGTASPESPRTCPLEGRPVELRRLAPLQLRQRLLEAQAGGGPVLCDEAPQPDGLCLSGTLVPLFEGGDPRPAASPEAVTVDGDDWNREAPVDPGPRGKLVGAVLLVRDVTGERRLQRRVLLGERMAAVGQLAAGLAHEINNPVSIAYADLQLARDLLSGHPSALPTVFAELPELLEECLTGVGRVRDIVRDLRTFTSTEVRNQPGEAHLDEVVELAVRLTRSEVQRRARLVYDRDLLPLPTVRVDPGRLGHVVMNLLHQAVSNLPPLDVSGPGGHRITVRTRADLRRGMAELVVADSGPTISEELRARLFEPFAPRQRRLPPGLSAELGMGLAVAYEVVRRSGGEIEARPGRDGGNELLVRLPLFNAPKAARGRP